MAGGEREQATEPSSESAGPAAAAQSAGPAAMALSPQGLLALQRSAGNRAVRGLVPRAPATPPQPPPVVMPDYLHYPTLAGFGRRAVWRYPEALRPRAEPRFVPAAADPELPWRTDQIMESGTSPEIVTMANVGTWMHDNFELIDRLLLEDAESLTAERLPPGLKEFRIEDPEQAVGEALAGRPCRLGQLRGHRDQAGAPQGGRGARGRDLRPGDGPLPQPRPGPPVEVALRDVRPDEGHRLPRGDRLLHARAARRPSAVLVARRGVHGQSDPDRAQPSRPRSRPTPRVRQLDAGLQQLYGIHAPEDAPVVTHPAGGPPGSRRTARPRPETADRRPRRHAKQPDLDPGRGARVNASTRAGNLRRTS